MGLEIADKLLLGTFFFGAIGYLFHRKKKPSAAPEREQVVTPNNTKVFDDNRSEGEVSRRSSFETICSSEESFVKVCDKGSTTGSAIRSSSHASRRSEDVRGFVCLEGKRSAGEVIPLVGPKVLKKKGTLPQAGDRASKTRHPRMHSTRETGCENSKIGDFSNNKKLPSSSTYPASLVTPMLKINLEPPSSSSTQHPETVRKATAKTYTSTSYQGLPTAATLRQLHINNNAGDHILDDIVVQDGALGFATRRGAACCGTSSQIAAGDAVLEYADTEAAEDYYTPPCTMSNSSTEATTSLDWSSRSNDMLDRLLEQISRETRKGSVKPAAGDKTSRVEDSEWPKWKVKRSRHQVETRDLERLANSFVHYSPKPAPEKVASRKGRVTRNIAERQIALIEQCGGFEVVSTGRRDSSVQDLLEIKKKPSKSSDLVRRPKPNPSNDRKAPILDHSVDVPAPWATDIERKSSSPVLLSVKRFEEDVSVTKLMEKTDNLMLNADQIINNMKGYFQVQRKDGTQESTTPKNSPLKDGKPTATQSQQLPQPCVLERRFRLEQHLASIESPHRRQKLGKSKLVLTKSRALPPAPYKNIGSLQRDGVVTPAPGTVKKWAAALEGKIRKTFQNRKHTGSLQRKPQPPPASLEGHGDLKLHGETNAGSTTWHSMAEDTTGLGSGEVQLTSGDAKLDVETAQPLLSDVEKVASQTEESKPVPDSLPSCTLATMKGSDKKKRSHMDGTRRKLVSELAQFFSSRNKRKSQAPSPTPTCSLGTENCTAIQERLTPIRRVLTESEDKNHSIKETVRALEHSSVEADSREKTEKKMVSKSNASTSASSGTLTEPETERTTVSDVLELSPANEQAMSDDTDCLVAENFDVSHPLESKGAAHCLLQAGANTGASGPGSRPGKVDNGNDEVGIMPSETNSNYCQSNRSGAERRIKSATCFVAGTKGGRSQNQGKTACSQTLIKPTEFNFRGDQLITGADKMDVGGPRSGDKPTATSKPRKEGIGTDTPSFGNSSAQNLHSEQANDGASDDNVNFSNPRRYGFGDFGYTCHPELASAPTKPKKEGAGLMQAERLSDKNTQESVEEFYDAPNHDSFSTDSVLRNNLGLDVDCAENCQANKLKPSLRRTDARKVDQNDGNAMGKTSGRLWENSASDTALPELSDRTSCSPIDTDEPATEASDKHRPACHDSSHIFFSEDLSGLDDTCQGFLAPLYAWLQTHPTDEPPEKEQPNNFLHLRRAFSGRPKGSVTAVYRDSSHLFSSDYSADSAESSQGFVELLYPWLSRKQRDNTNERPEENSTKLLDICREFARKLQVSVTRELFPQALDDASTSSTRQKRVSAISRRSPKLEVSSKHVLRSADRRAKLGMNSAFGRLQAPIKNTSGSKESSSETSLSTGFEELLPAYPKVICEHLRKLWPSVSDDAQPAQPTLTQSDLWSESDLSQAS